MGENSIYKIDSRTDLTGYRFSKLVVEGQSRETQKKARHWVCRCDCGGSTIASTENLNRGHTQSCGCQKIIHGGKGSAEYVTWGNMIQRCSNPKHPMFPDYGGRGIQVDPTWRRFEEFIADMGPRPSPDHSIERNNNDGPYAPGNCSWATVDVQANNKRNSVRHQVDGRDMTEKEIEGKYGISPTLLRTRMSKGMSAQEAAEMPIRRHRAYTPRNKDE